MLDEIHYFEKINNQAAKSAAVHHARVNDSASESASNDLGDASPCRDD